MAISSESYVPRDWSRPVGVFTLEGHERGVYSVIELKDGKLASCSGDETIKIWDWHQQKCVATLEGHTRAVQSVIELQEGNLASGSDDKTIKIWDRRGMCMGTLKGHERGVYSVIELKDGKLASCSGDKTIKIWDRNSRFIKCVTTLGGHRSGVLSVIELKDGKLASGSVDHTIKIWDRNARFKKCVASFEGHMDYVNTVIELKDGNLASGSRDTTIKIWDRRMQHCVSTLKGHKKWVNSVIELKDGKLASGSPDCAIRIWDRDTQQCVATLEGGGVFPVFSLIELKDGTLASGCSYGKIVCWIAEPGPTILPKTSEVVSQSSLSSTTSTQLEEKKSPRPVSADSSSLPESELAKKESPRRRSPSAGEVEKLREELAQLRISLPQGEPLESLHQQLVRAHISMEAVTTCVGFVQEWGGELQTVVQNQRAFEINSQEQEELLNHCNAHVGDYYEMVWMRLADTLIACKTMHSGHVANSFDNNFVTAGKVLGYVDTAASMGEKHADKVFSAAKGILSVENVAKVAGAVGSVAEAIPYVGIFTKVVGKIAGFVGEQEQKRAVMRLAKLCREINRIDSLTEVVARHLTNQRMADLLKLPQPSESQSRIKPLKKRWQLFVADELTTKSKKLAAADADTIIEAVAKGNSTFVEPDLAQKLVQILFADFQEGVASQSTSSQGITLSPVSQQGGPSVLAAEQQLAILQRMEEMEKEQRRLHGEVTKLKQQNATEVDAGNSPKIFASVTSNPQWDGISLHGVARDLSVHEVRLQRLEMETAIRTEDQPQTAEADPAARAKLLGKDKPSESLR